MWVVWGWWLVEIQRGDHEMSLGSDKLTELHIFERRKLLTKVKIYTRKHGLNRTLACRLPIFSICVFAVQNLVYKFRRAQLFFAPPLWELMVMFVAKHNAPRGAFGLYYYCFTFMAGAHFDHPSRCAIFLGPLINRVLTHRYTFLVMGRCSRSLVKLYIIPRITYLAYLACTQNTRQIVWFQFVTYTMVHWALEP